ncbi:MAG TPA: metal-dependent transcriptional regulator [Candidatus Limiplasma sp.]|mgnify:CR=1 FL=1|nr:metal-dependent transcriptional regulator [Candidatus Limiplasma sp.]
MSADHRQPITPVKENYLRVLLDLSKNKAVRTSDIARALAVTKPSVSCMIKRLRQEGYVTQEKYGTVTLTEKGQTNAADVKRRYMLLTTFLTRFLGVDAATAAADACRIEHSISPESLYKLAEHMHRAALSAQQLKGEYTLCQEETEQAPWEWAPKQDAV